MEPRVLYYDVVRSVQALEIWTGIKSDDRALVMLMAIAGQESAWAHRRQIGGPARSYWQFEKGGGVAGVLSHPGTKGAINAVCTKLDIPCDTATVYEAMAWNDTLAACMARLLLYSDPRPLPAPWHAAPAVMGHTLRRGDGSRRPKSTPRKGRLMPALIPLLLGLAPTVADWIFGDKTGKAVGKVSEIAKSVLGTDDPGAIERAVAADPNLALQFKQAIIQAAADARRVELDSFRAQLADVQSARTQTVDLAKANSAIAWGAPIISAIVLAAFGAALWAVLKEEVPAGSRDIANIMLGTLGAMASAVVGYWVGSSAGSASKDSALRQIVGR